MLQLKPIRLTIKDITVGKRKFRSIIEETGAFTYNCSKVIPANVKPLRRNEYSIKDAQCFPEMLRNLPLLNNDEEYFLHDVDSIHNHPTKSVY